MMIPLRASIRWGRLWRYTERDESRRAKPLRVEALGAYWRSDRYTQEEADRWQEPLIARAQAILTHHLDLFDLRGHDLGGPINWNYEYKARKKTPMTLAGSIDYRDYHVTGDCKFVWEPNRHQHWVVLGRAYQVTQDERYAEAIVAQFESWIRQCPYGWGMNWRSPLELAIRLISWTWAFALIEGSKAMSAARRRTLIQSVSQHVFEISRKYSRYSSANNHLIGEAAGVFIASSVLPGLKGALRYRARSRALLLSQILRQTYPDGGTREQATGYHLFVLEFFLLAGLVARNVGDDLAPEYWERLERMFDFAAALSDATGKMPMIGDADDGYVIDLGGRSDWATSLLSVGAVLFGRGDFKLRAGGFSEPAFWLLGSGGRKAFEAINTDDVKPVLTSRDFPDSGYYLLQRGRRDGPERISLLFDCGELGFLSIAAHGHADALSIVLRIAGFDVLVDPGTYDYFSFEGWRDYFRSTRAHNTVVVDDADQSQMLGSFLWGRQARCRLLQWNDRRVSAEHDGYSHGPDPVVHRRTVTLDDKQDKLIIQDDIRAKGQHTVTMFWHFAEPCRVIPQEAHRFDVDFGGGHLSMSTDPRLSVSLVSGREDPILGWVSRGYHRKSPATTMVCRCRSDGPLSLTTEMIVHSPKRRGSASHSDHAAEAV